MGCPRKIDLEGDDVSMPGNFELKDSLGRRRHLVAEGSCCSSSLLKEFRLEADGINEMLEVVAVFLIDDGVFVYKNEAVGVSWVEER